MMSKHLNLTPRLGAADVVLVRMRSDSLTEGRGKKGSADLLAIAFY